MKAKENLEEQTRAARNTLDAALASVLEQKEAIDRWTAAGVDPHANTDYVSSDRQWEREYEELEEREQRVEQARAELDALLSGKQSA